MVTVMCFGTFDLLHAGHRFYLQQAKAYGDRLIVVVARDSTVRAVKGYPPVHTEAERLAAVQAVPGVDHAVLGNPGDKLKVILEHKPEVIALGYDQQAFTEQLAERLAAKGIRPKIVRIPPHEPERYKTSKIRAEKLKGR